MGLREELSMKIFMILTAGWEDYCSCKSFVLYYLWFWVERSKKLAVKGWQQKWSESWLLREIIRSEKQLSGVVSWHNVKIILRLYIFYLSSQLNHSHLIVSILQSSPLQQDLLKCSPTLHNQVIKNSYVDGEDDYQDAVSGVRAPVFDTVSTTSVVHSAVSGVARLKCSVLNLGDKTVTIFA